MRVFFLLVFIVLSTSAEARKGYSSDPHASADVKVSLKLYEPITLRISAPLRLQQGMDIDSYNQFSGMYAIPLNKPTVTILGASGMNYQVEIGDGKTLPMYVEGEETKKIADRTIPSNGMDIFNIDSNPGNANLFAKKRGQNIQPVTVTYDSK
ncbi:MAG: hypothetical protein V1647_03580 [Pseudomonadota bacterium]